MSDADTAGCSYIVTVWSTETPNPDADTRHSRSDSDFLSGSDPGFPPPAPLNFSAMRREPTGWWNSLPDKSYNSSKWFAQAIADEVYAVILKHPTP